MELISRMNSEHRLIEAMLDCLQAYAGSLTEGCDADRGRLADVVRFLRGYADALHHGKEEEILFAGLRAQGCPDDLAPVLDAVTREHQTGRNLVDDLSRLARRTGPWSAAECAAAQRAARGVVTMLRRHIADEDERVFPQVVERLAPGTAARLEDACRRFEAAHAAERADLERLAARLLGRA
jgi:hemerythrin-like domain-containing protein